MKSSGTATPFTCATRRREVSSNNSAEFGIDNLHLEKRHNGLPCPSAKAETPAAQIARPWWAGTWGTCSGGSVGM